MAMFTGDTTAEFVTVTALVPRADAVKYVLTENDFLIVNGVVGPTQVCVCVCERERDRENKLWSVDGCVGPAQSVCVHVCECV